MLPRLCKMVLVILLTTSSLTVDAAKRRSRIESPIINGAEAPLVDNISTTSASDVTIVKKESAIVTIPSISTEVAEKESISEYSNEDMTYDECDSDNISFELITGYASLYVILIENIV